MAKKLSKEEQKSQDGLERDMDTRVLAYKKEKEQQLKDGKKEELVQELASIEKYLLGCRNSEIADVLPNIQFAHRKAKILRELLH